MKHPMEVSLRAYMDGELPLATAAAVGEHLSSCAECSASVAELRDTAAVFSAAMGRMDAAEPERWQMPAADSRSAGASAVDDDARDRVLRLVAPESAWRRSGPAAGVTPVRVAERDRPRQIHRPGRLAPAPVMRWAAGLALAVAIGGSAAIAGGLLDRSPEPASPVAATRPAEPAPVPAGGVFGRPVNGAMEVVLTGAPAGSRVVIDWTDAEEVLVEVAGAPEAGVLYRDGEERMVANLADRAGIVHVTMPRGLRSATVVWQGRIVVQVAEGTVTPEGAAGEGVVLEAQR